MNKKELTFKKLKYSDIDEVVELENLIFPTPWTADMVEHSATSVYSNFYVLKNKEERIVAYFGLWLSLDEGHINNFAVHPEFRGNKIGSMMMDKIFELGKQAGVKIYFLEVRKSNTAAVKLYKKYGFFEAGMRRNYYSDPKEDALLMTRIV